MLKGPALVVQFVQSSIYWDLREKLGKAGDHYLKPP